MSIATILGILGLITGTTLTAGGLHNGLISNNVNDVANSYEKVKSLLEEEGIENLTTDQLINLANERGLISKEEHSRAMNQVREFEKRYNDEGFWGDLKYALYDIAHTPKTDRKTKELYELLADNIPNISENIPDNMTVDEYLNGIANKTTPSTPAPNYLDTNFRGTQINVNPLKWWTGQELADLHGIGFDPDIYYDAIKEGTSAAIDYALYTNEQATQASRRDDTVSMNSYLDNIRNSKADAIINGATLGAQMANDLLANTGASTDYSTMQTEIANQNIENMVDPYRNDARARLDAVDYYNQIADSLSGDIETLYYNDVNRRGGELYTNAQLFAADEALRQANIRANANMGSTYNTARTGNAIANPYLQLYKIAFNSTADSGMTDKQRIADAQAFVDQQIRNKYTGFNNAIDYYNAVKSN